MKEGSAYPTSGLDPSEENTSYLYQELNQDSSVIQPSHYTDQAIPAPRVPILIYIIAVYIAIHYFLSLLHILLLNSHLRPVFARIPFF